MPMSIRALSACLLVITVHAASAQQSPQQPTPEQMRQVMQATMGAMVSVMGPLTEAIIEAQLTIAAKPETADRIAVFKKNLYDALIQKGFKAAGAIQIVVATAAPTASPSAK